MLSAFTAPVPMEDHPLGGLRVSLFALVVVESIHRILKLGEIDESGRRALNQAERFLASAAAFCQRTHEIMPSDSFTATQAFKALVDVVPPELGLEEMSAYLTEQATRIRRYLSGEQADLAPVQQMFKHVLTETSEESLKLSLQADAWRL